MTHLNANLYSSPAEPNLALALQHHIDAIAGLETGAGPAWPSARSEGSELRHRYRSAYAAGVTSAIATDDAAAVSFMLEYLAGRRLAGLLRSAVDAAEYKAEATASYFVTRGDQRIAGHMTDEGSMSRRERTQKT